MNEMIDWKDIDNWHVGIANYKRIVFDESEEWRRSSHKIYDARDFNLDSEKLYCLLKSIVHEHPTGIYTMMLNEAPLDNLFYWDYIIEYEGWFIHIWRKNSTVEFLHNIDDDQFDIGVFFHTNLLKYKKSINAVYRKLEIHDLYINHFESYRKICKYLWDEIYDVNLDRPNIYGKTPIDSGPDNLKLELDKFVTNSIKFHALGKSLILNAAFMAEACLNTLIRIMGHQGSKLYPKMLNKFLSMTLKDKINNLGFYTSGFHPSISSSDPEVVNILKVMTRRNKYVHSDNSSFINQLGHLRFDRSFPVFPNFEHGPLVHNIELIYHRPNFEEVALSYDYALNFVDYLFERINPQIFNYVDGVSSANPLSFNNRTKNFSLIYNGGAVDGFFRLRAEEE